MLKQKDIEKLQIETKHEEVMENIKTKGEIDKLNITNDHTRKMQQMADDKDIKLNSQDIDFKIKNEGRVFFFFG